MLVVPRLQGEGEGGLVGPRPGGMYHPKLPRLVTTRRTLYTVGAYVPIVITYIMYQHGRASRSL